MGLLCIGWLLPNLAAVLVNFIARPLVLLVMAKLVVTLFVVNVIIKSLSSALCGFLVSSKRVILDI